MFEMCTPKHIIKVQYKENHMILLGARHIETYKEQDPKEIGVKYGWRVIESKKIEDIAKENNINNLEPIEVLEKSANSKEPIKFEGYVVVDDEYHRIKLKNAAYVSLSHLSLRGDKKEAGFKYNCRCLLNIARYNEGSEFLGYFPEYEKRYFQIKCFYDELIEEKMGRILKKKKQEVQKKKQRQRTTQALKETFGIQQLTKENKFLYDIIMEAEDTMDIRQGMKKVELKRIEKLIRYPAFKSHK